MDDETIINVLRTLVAVNTDDVAIGAVVKALLGTPQAPPPAKTTKAKSAVAAEPVLDQGAVIVPKGQQCTCGLCDKVVYNVIANVHEHTPKKQFVAAFQPVGHAPVLAMPLDVWSDPYGNMAINCPLCKGDKTLWIKGKGDKLYGEYPTTATGDTP